MTREEWLERAAAIIGQRIVAAGFPSPGAIHVSIGFPSRNPLGRRSRRIGECWSRRAGNGTAHILISPLLADPAKILEVLSHELVHASVGLECGHRGRFIALARALGHKPPWTATSAGADMEAAHAAILDVLGPFPGTALEASALEDKKQTTRLRLFECAGCGLKVRIARDAVRLRCEDCDLPLVRPGRLEA